MLSTSFYPCLELFLLHLQFTQVARACKLCRLQRTQTAPTWAYASRKSPARQQAASALCMERLQCCPLHHDQIQLKCILTHALSTTTSSTIHTVLKGYGICVTNQCTCLTKCIFQFYQEFVITRSTGFSSRYTI